MITLEQGALVSLLLGALATLIARKWVPGWIYDQEIEACDRRIELLRGDMADLKTDRDFWRDQAIDLLRATRTVTEVVEQHVVGRTP